MSYGSTHLFSAGGQKGAIYVFYLFIFILLGSFKAFCLFIDWENMKSDVLNNYSQYYSGRRHCKTGKQKVAIIPFDETFEQVSPAKETCCQLWYQ